MFYRLLQDQFDGKIWLVEADENDKKFIEDMFFPTKILSINSVWAPGGIQKTKAVVSGKWTPRFPINTETVIQIVKNARAIAEALSSHDFRDLTTEADYFRKLIVNAQEKYPSVKFKFEEAAEAMRQVALQGKKEPELILNSKLLRDKKGKPEKFIVETKQGEIAAYIPTNLISITDGQIYLDHSLYVSGFRPAIDVARSVSRIGGAAQHHRITEETGRMKLDYLQFLELEVFTRFGARLEASMEISIRRGRVLREILKQERLKPLPAIVQLAWLVAYNDGCFEGVDPEDISEQFDTLEKHARRSALTLDSPRIEWSNLAASCLNYPEGAAQT